MTSLSIAQIWQSIYDSVVNKLGTQMVAGPSTFNRSKLSDAQIMNKVYDDATKKIRLVKV